MPSSLKDKDPAQVTQFFSPEIIDYLPPHKMYKIQIGGELFLISGASLSSDGPNSYFLDFFQNIENSPPFNENDSANDSGKVNVDIQQRVLFIDRDPEIFKYIYNHLQGYFINIPDEIVFTKLFADAMYYNLPRLRKMLKESEFYYVNVGGESFKINKNVFRADGNNKNYFKITAEMIYQDIEEFFINSRGKRFLRPPPQMWSYCGRSPKLLNKLLDLLNNGRFDGTLAERHNLLKECRFYRLLKLEQELISHRFFSNPFKNSTEIFVNLFDIRTSEKNVGLMATDFEVGGCVSGGNNNGSSNNSSNANNVNNSNANNSNMTSNNNSTNSNFNNSNTNANNTNSTSNSTSNSSNNNSNNMNKKRKLNSEAQLQEISISDICSSDDQTRETPIPLACDPISPSTPPDSDPWHVLSYSRPYVDAWKYPLVFQIGNSVHSDEKVKAVDHCFVNTVKTIDESGKIIVKPNSSSFLADPDCTVNFGSLLFDAEKGCCYVVFEGLVAVKLHKLLKVLLSEASIQKRYLFPYKDATRGTVQRIILPCCVKFSAVIIDNKPIKSLCTLLKDKLFLRNFAMKKIESSETGSTITGFTIPLCDRSVWRMHLKTGINSGSDEVMMLATKLRCGSLKEYNNYF